MFDHEYPTLYYEHLACEQKDFTQLAVKADIDIQYGYTIMPTKTNLTIKSAPLLDQSAFTFENRTPNASFFNNAHSIYKAHPSPQVDEALEYIADTPVLVITRDDIKKMVKDPDYAVELPEDFGRSSSPFMPFSKSNRHRKLTAKLRLRQRHVHRRQRRATPDSLHQ